MGYTHYYKQKEKLTYEEIDKIVSLSKRIIDNLPEHSLSSDGDFADYPIVLCSNHYAEEKAPIVNSTEININGKRGDDDLAHETFYIRFNSMRRSDFCKTARKPYDYVVQAILSIIYTVAPNSFRITSDGDGDDWKWSVDTASKILGIPLTNPIR